MPGLTEEQPFQAFLPPSVFSALGALTPIGTDHGDDEDDE